MTKPIVLCRCGHQVLGREVMRTEFYERASGQEMVYVKFRCRRCKRLGESFIPQETWDWSIFAAPRNEMTESERDSFVGKQDISSSDVLSFHRDLKRISNLTELMGPTPPGRGRPAAELKAKEDAPKGRQSNGESSGKRRRRNQ